MATRSNCRREMPSTGLASRAMVTLIIGCCMAILFPWPDGADAAERRNCVQSDQKFYLAAAQYINQQQNIGVDIVRDGRKYGISATYIPYDTPQALLHSVKNCCQIRRNRGRGDGRPPWYEYNSAGLVAVDITYIAKYRDRSGRAGAAIKHASVDVTRCYEIKPFPR
jgi:hypothetical protein